MAARSRERPWLSDLRPEETEIGAPADGEVLSRVPLLSLDPHMRTRMSAAPSYARPVEIGAVMEGGALGEVVESRSRSR